MNKYLIELIKLQNSVILPGFGALMIGNSKSGKIVFNPHLKFNDGALAKFISEKDGIDTQAAQNQIAKFVREIEAELAKGNSFDIFQFGKFSKKSDGTIEFVQEPGTAVASDDSKKTATAEKPAVKPVEVKKPAEVKPEIKVTIQPTAESPVKAEVKKTESLLDKLKASESVAESKKTEAEKITDQKLSAEEASKQIKNSFKPADEKPDTIDKPVEISKNIPLAEASKKDPAAQVKNSFKPSEEIKKEGAKTEDKLVAATDPLKPEGTKKTDDLKAQSAHAEKTKEELPKKESVKEKFKKDKPQRVKHENPEAKKPKKKGAVKWIVLIILLGGGITAGLMYKDQINHFLFAGVGDHDQDTTHAVTDQTHDTTQVVVNEEPVVEDSTLTEIPVENTEETIEEPVEEVKTNPIVNHSSPGGTYHIIGGSFSSEQNADKYVKKMSEKGYSAQNIGKHKGLYLVSLKSFGSNEEAKNNLSSVKADASGAYVFKGN